MIQLLKHNSQTRIYKITTNDLWADPLIEAEDKFATQLFGLCDEQLREQGMHLASIAYFRDAWIVIFQPR